MFSVTQRRKAGYSKSDMPNMHSCTPASSQTYCSAMLSLPPDQAKAAFGLLQTKDRTSFTALYISSSVSCLGRSSAFAFINKKSSCERLCFFITLVFRLCECRIFHELKLRLPLLGLPSGGHHALAQNHYLDEMQRFSCIARFGQF